jgi:GT2 family glycosyltransferase
VSGEASWRAARVTVVLAAHNDWAHTARCLASLLQVSSPSFTTCLVDDGSTDGTAQHAAALGIHVLLGDGSLWWAESVNVGMRAAFAGGASYVLVLNNDVLVDANTISSLVACADAHPRCLVGSLVLYHDNPQRVWCAGGTISWPVRGEAMMGGGKHPNTFAKPFEVDWLPGMGTLIPRALFEQIGGYDSVAMPQYLADTDYALRARRAGWRIIVEPRSRVYNDVANTGGVRCERGIRGAWRTLRQAVVDPRSPDYWPARWGFIRRHCPTPLVPFAVALRYLRVTAHVLRRAM